MRTARNASYPALILLLVFCLIIPVGKLHADESPAAIRLGIISIASPSKIYTQWKPFAEYIMTQTGRKVELVVPKGFNKIKQGIEDKAIDIFYVNSYVFYRLKEEGKVKPLAQMVNLNGTTTSKSILFVRNDSGINTLQDLIGEKVAFISPMGAGGYLAPREKFHQYGIKTPTDTDEQFTSNLSSSIHKVLTGEVKAGTMCGLNFKLMSERIATGDLKIIAETEKYPENVFGARADLEPRLQKHLAEIIIHMENTLDGSVVLKNMHDMKILRFSPYDDRIENITRSLIKNTEFDQP